MPKKIYLTGIKPTGVPHLGNYFGAMKPGIEIANRDDLESFYFIADYHSLISIHERKKIQDYTYEVAASWVAMGLNLTNAVLYKQSQIPEILELTWILSCFAPKGLMNRAHAYKAAVQQNKDNQREEDERVSMGLYNYPILMTADILIGSANFVPVGSDQLQHLEIARDIAASFNRTYGNTLTLPSPETGSSKSSLIPGIDGRKMSKSYDNHIPLFLPEKKLRKLIMRIKTDSMPPEAPKDPHSSIIFQLYQLVASEQEVLQFQDRFIKGISWGEAKEELFQKLNDSLEGPREKYNELMGDKSKIDDILATGAEKIRPRAQKLLAQVRKKIGITA